MPEDYRRRSNRPAHRREASENQNEGSELGNDVGPVPENGAGQLLCVLRAIRMSLPEFFTIFASRFSDFYKAHVFWRKIQRAMALNQRGEVRTDGLQMTSAKT